jgi:hypothetical protein
MINRFFIAAFLIITLNGCNNKSSNNILETNTSKDSIPMFSYSEMEEAEMKLIDTLEAKYGNPKEDFEIDMLNDELIEFVIKEPLTLDYPFDSLQSRGFADIVTSEDGNLRFYCWDDRSGGTCISWRSICQYRSGDKVYTYKGDIRNLKDNPQKEEGYIDCSISNIKTIYTKSDSPIYLVDTYIRFSSKWGNQSIEAIKIEDDKLVAVPIFVDRKEEYDNINSGSKEYIAMCSRGFNYTIADWYFRANKGEGWAWLFRYDDKTNTLYLPLTDYDQRLSDRYSLYRFDGEKLCYIGDDGGFWLHPSIRDFNFLELVLETKDYRARVDRMADSTYRYVSWKNKATMADTPDIILHNGIYNEESGDYSFKHGEYEYIVNENTGLVVKNKNKIILSQKRDFD